MLYIRADANETIAMGHIMRCLSIAQALRRLGEESTFILSDRKAVFCLEERGYPYICLESDWCNKESELDSLFQIIEEYHIEKILVDSYQVTEKYLRELKQRVKLCYIDDINIMPDLVDVLICYSITYEEMSYGKGYVGKTKLLLGPQYSPLRQEFTNRSPIEHSEIRKVFLTTGGADTYHVSAVFLHTCMNLQDMKKLEFHVIIGGFYDISLKKQLVQLQHKFPNIHLYEHVKNMAEVMSECDIAISAGGSTLLELCACGVPTVCFTYANNQVDGAKFYDKQEIILYAGDVREEYDGVERVIGRLIEKVRKLMIGSQTRKMLSCKMQKLVDGQGADRIANVLRIM